MDLGFLKIAAAVPSVKVGDCTYNAGQIADMIHTASEQGVSIVAFPELCITGYTCADLFGQPFLLEQAEKALARLIEQTASCPIICLVGMPVAADNRIYNAAVVFGMGTIYGIVPKTYLPNYNEYYEGRWFASGTELRTDTFTLCGQSVPFANELLFESEKICFAVEICEDLWVPIPPSSHHAVAGANLLINLSASNEMTGKHTYLRSLIAQQSARTLSAYLYCSCGFGESSTDVVFAGNGIIAENGILVKESERFAIEEQFTIADVDIERLMTLRRKTNTFADYNRQTPYQRIAVPLRSDRNDYPIERSFDPHPFIPQQAEAMQERCEEIVNIQVNGLAQRIRHTGVRSAVIGISGGLDSTLALLITTRTFDKLGLPRTAITGITMPGFGTTGRTHTNALKLMELLGITTKEINICEACNVHFRDIGLDALDRSTTYENAQARERTQILMDMANRNGGLVIGTGDLSELALGWATYNGDHMSMYGVNCGVPKTLVHYLVQWIADLPESTAIRACLLDIVDTPISPELLPASQEGEILQKTEDLVGPYELHDFFLYHFVRFGYRPVKLHFMAKRAFADKYPASEIKKWLIVFLRRFFNQQFKRSALPDGPKVGSISLSPRGDWRMPSDASVSEWLREAESL
ncbi:MAG TPA: NAD(+) synthase [Candidatus Alistipes merdigallinarum]|nr:NAD(+) synthase [Candidatus Alistipes merdigallinarum]